MGYNSQMSFAKRLMKLRTDAGLTQVDLTDKTSMHWSELAKLERGEKEPSWREVQALSHALAVSCEAFAEPKRPPLK
jgi:predicted transcriptional regulator